MHDALALRHIDGSKQAFETTEAMCCAFGSLKRLDGLGSARAKKNEEADEAGDWDRMTEGLQVERDLLRDDLAGQQRSCVRPLREFREGGGNGGEERSVPQNAPVVVDHLHFVGCSFREEILAVLQLMGKKGHTDSYTG